MKKDKRYVLVLGSKPNSKFPDIKVDKIYSANGSAERAIEYKKKYPGIFHTALTAAAEFNENKDVSSRIIKSRPDKLFVRMGKIYLNNEFKETKEIIYMDQNEQLDFQSKFYKYGRLDLIFGEIFYYENTFWKIIKHLQMCLSYRGFLGASTGFFSILLAISENPEAEIIVSGIGLNEGGHFYTSENSYGYVSKKMTKLIENNQLKIDNKFRNTSRSRVERFLINRIKKKYKSKIISTDKELVKNANVLKWEGELF